MPVARFPALVFGALLVIAGLALFLEDGTTPTNAFPDGAASGSELAGFETNGWTAWITTAAGGLLLLGSATRVTAKVASVVGGLVLGAAAVMGLWDGDVLGLAATNGPVDAAWGACAVLLVLTGVVPSARRARDRQRERLARRAIAEHEARRRASEPKRPRVAPQPKVAPPPALEKAPSASERTPTAVHLTRS